MARSSISETPSRDDPNVCRSSLAGTGGLLLTSLSPRTRIISLIDPVLLRQQGQYIIWYPSSQRTPWKTTRATPQKTRPSQAPEQSGTPPRRQATLRIAHKLQSEAIQTPSPPTPRSRARRHLDSVIPRAVDLFLCRSENQVLRNYFRNLIVLVLLHRKIRN